MTSATLPTQPTSSARVVLDSDAVSKALTRIAHEILEKQAGLDGLVLLGIQRGGVWICQEIAQRILQIAGRPVPQGSLDVTFYRDDVGKRLPSPHATLIPEDITDKTVILVDDVLFSGRTIRAACDALNDYGRPRRIRLAVLVDRGHRELPIAPDFVGKNIPTSRSEKVMVNAGGVEVRART